MAKKLFVGNLSWDTTDTSLSDLFSTIGQVISAKVITDKFSGRSRGFAFVEMANDDEADRAIAELNGKDLDNRQISVSEARPQERQNDNQGFRSHSGRDNQRRGDRRNNY